MALSRAEIVERARRHVGHREVTPNRSRLIDEWVRACGLDPAGGYPWCAAFASWCLGLQPGIAGALKLGRWGSLTLDPVPGDLMYFRTDEKGAGHCGIVLDAAHPLEVLCSEGNSDNGVRLVRRLKGEVMFARTVPLEWYPDVPLVHPAKVGTR